ASAQTPSSPQTPPSQPPATPSQPPSSPSSPYPSGQASASEHGGSKLTGCVQAGTTAGSFELTNVKKGSSSASSSSSSSPSSSSPSASASASASDKGTVKLMASPSVDLSTHVGHTVEVSGKWAAGGDSASPSASAPGASSSSSMGKEFQVSSVK